MAAKTALRVVVFLVGLCACVPPASATSVSFTFDPLSPSSGNNSSAVASYMTSVLVAAGCTGCSVTVSGAATDTTYNGDGHVVGPVTGTAGHPVYKSLTLGDSNGATSNSGTPNSTYDTFLANTTNGSSQISQEISIAFHGLTIASACFDFEIFPDGSSEQAPDFSFTTGAASGGTPVSSFGSGGTQLGVKPSTTANGTSTHSPNSQSGTEASAQYLGHWCGGLNNASQLNFIDWPATIGIDNLQVTTPEPGTVVQFFAGLLGLGGLSVPRLFAGRR